MLPSILPDIGIKIFKWRCWWFLVRGRAWIWLDTRMFWHTIRKSIIQSSALLSRRACNHKKATLPNWYIKKCYFLLVFCSQNLWSDLWVWNCNCASSLRIFCLFILKKKIKVMDEVKEDRGSHLIGALRNCQNKLIHFYYYSPYAARIDWTMSLFSLLCPFSPQLQIYTFIWQVNDCCQAYWYRISMNLHFRNISLFFF